MKPSIEIEFAARPEGNLAREIADLVNRVYEVAEEGLWVQGAARTNVGEIAQLIAAGQIAVARLGGEIVGIVRVQQLDALRGEFGMLVADPSRRGEGIGRELVEFAQETVRQRGLSIVQLELLQPRGWTHPTKAFLRAWYMRMGYQPVQSGSIDGSYPELAPLLATPCDLVVYQKELAPIHKTTRPYSAP